MNILVKKLMALSGMTFAYLLLQSSALAQPMMVPELLIVEESYLEPADGQDSSNVYFTITNLHRDPIRLLKTKTSSGEYESASFVGANNEQLEYIEILPSQRLVMEPNGMHVQLNNVDSTISSESQVEFTLLVRQGREALPYQEGGFDIGTRRQIREGIPNEHEFTVRVPVRGY